MKMLCALMVVLPLVLSPGCSAKFDDLSEPEGIKTKLNSQCVKVLENAAEFEIVSIDPWAKVGSKDATFRGYRLLGKTTVKDKRIRRQVADAIYDSVNQGTASALCFDPRHVVRASVAGKTFDFVICFQCDNMHVHPGPDDSYWHYPISKSAKPVLQKILNDADIPQAPE
jgi:hypothetical protein